MYLSRLVAAVAFLALGTLCPQAYASGNVLVPSDDAPAPDQAQSPPANESSDTAPVLPAALDTAPTPAPDSDAAAAPVPAPAQNYSPVPDSLAATMPPPKPPQVIQMPDMTSIAPDSGLPYSLAIAIPDQYRWSYNDMSAIQNILGIGPDAVPQHCRLSANGMLQSSSDMGVYPFDLGRTNRMLVPYDGALRSVSIFMHALCDMVPLPPSASNVMQVGDKYFVPLFSSISCEPPPPSVRQVSIQYSNTGEGKCVYE